MDNNPKIDAPTGAMGRGGKMTTMTDEELAAKLEAEARTFTKNDFRALLEEASSRIYALSAHVALLKASLAQAEREAEKPTESAKTEPFAYGWRHVANEWADELCNALQGIRNIEDGTQPTAEVAGAIQRGIDRCRGLSVGLPEESAQPAASAEPVGVRPYEPTEAMRWAAKVIDPALSHEQIRALWASMWSAYAPGEVGIPTSEPVDCQFQGRDGKWYGFTNEQQRLNTIADGTWPIRLLYAAPQPDRVAELAAEVERLRGLLSGLVDDIQGLMSESDGVAGLHLNGDVAPWSELEAGARFERLTHLPEAALAGKEAQS